MSTGPDTDVPARPKLAAAISCLVIGLLLAGFALLRKADRESAAMPVPVANWGSPLAPARPGGADSASPGQAPARSAASATLPAGSVLSLDRFGTQGPVVAVRAVAGVMQVPADPGTLGWWSQGAAPGAGRGSSVLVGHVDYAGRSGLLSVLPRTRPGELIHLREPSITLAYRIRAVLSYPKSNGIPSAVFSRSGPEQLVLITCGGPFDAGSGNYLDNIVAYADPVR